MLLFQKLSLRTKLVLALVIVILVNMSVGLYYAAQVRQIMQFNQNAQNIYYNVNSIYYSIQEASLQVGLYRYEQSDYILDAYTQARAQASAQITGLTNEKNSTDEWYMIHAIQNSSEAMFNNYDTAIREIQDHKPAYYVEYYAGQKIQSYMAGYVNGYLNILLKENSRVEQELARKAQIAIAVSKSFLIFSALIGLAFSFAFSYWVTKPIRALSEAAKRISKGDMNVPDVVVINDDEIGNLTQTFNIMKDYISIAIETLKQRSELEARLHKEELKSSKNSELLKEAQYLALQSQINPHFLFNTLNAISRSVVHEDPDVTVTLVCNLADLFRYNLYHLHTNSKLEEELGIVAKYIYIQKHRFGDRVDYCVTGDTDCSDALIPSMLLQPLVENSLIHGIENLEFGGKIIVNVKHYKDMLQLRVYDNGMGMDRTTRNLIYDDLDMQHTGHTTGIGLSNIIRRLDLIPRSHIHIYSAIGRGTLIDILIPFERMVTHNDI